MKSNIRKKFFHFFPVFAIMECLIGCSPCRDIATSNYSNTEAKDSSSIEIRWRIIEVHDSVLIYIPVEKQSSIGEDSSHLETKYAKSDAWVDSTGKLHHNLENIPQEIQAHFDGYVLTSDTSAYESHITTNENRSNEKEIEYVELPLKWWQEALMRLGAITIIIGLGYMGIKIARKKLHLSSWEAFGSRWRQNATVCSNLPIHAVGRVTEPS